MNDLYQKVTDRIVAAWESGTPPWIREWQNSDNGLPRNLLTARPYRGVNLMLLNIEEMLRGYSDSRWLTYRQAMALGAHVRAGESGASIFFYKLREVDAKVSDEQPVTERKLIPLLRSFTVFNAAQVNGLPEQYLKPPAQPSWTPNGAAQKVLTDSGATIRHGGDQAFYLVSDDVIQLPPPNAFSTPEDYYATALHELTHWTGHPRRCHRPLGRRHGIDAYAFEELIAELGAAFLCAHCHLPARMQHASYINGWLDALKRDKRLIFVAASAAQKAVDFVLGDAAATTTDSTFSIRESA